MSRRRTMFLHSISSNDSPLCHWPCDVVKSSYSPSARQTYRFRSRSMEDRDIAPSSSSSSSSPSSPQSLDNHGLLEENRFEEKAPDDQDTYDDKKPMARSVAKFMNGDNHTSPPFDMRMTFSEDCDDDHRPFNAVSASALGILDGDHIGIGIIPHAPEFLLQSYQHFAARPETPVDEESVASHDMEEEKEEDDSEQKDEMGESFFMDHHHHMETAHPTEKVTRGSRRSSRVKATKVVRSSKAPAKFKNARKPSKQHVCADPKETHPEIKPTERELQNAVNRRQKEALQQWYGKLNELNQYRIAKGHCNVPQQYPPNPQLGIVSSTLCVDSLFNV